MITVLNTTENFPKTFQEKISAAFHPYSISTNFCSEERVNIFTVNYIQRKGNIRYDKIYQNCIGKPKTILCSKELILDNTPFKRFDDTEYQTLIMKNLIIELLKHNIKRDMKIIFYDPYAQYPSFLSEFLSYTSTLTVVSEMPKFYENEAARIMNETGASIIVKNDISMISPCDILIAPCTIEKDFPSCASEIIFTAAKPLVNCKGTVFYDYKVSLPEKMNYTIPDCIDETYFTAALYSLCKINELSHLSPYGCVCESKLISKEEIFQLIKNVVRN